MTANRWLPIHDAELEEETARTNFGGKYAGLMRVAADPDIRVPRGIGIAAEFVRLGQAKRDVLEDALRDEVLPHLESEAKRLEEYRTKRTLAVRSSANLEDGEILGFPGVFDTELGVLPRVKNLVEAIGKVFASSKGEKLDAYLALHDLPASRVEMGCVVQWLIPCKFSGVCMTSTNGRVRDNYLLLNFDEGDCKAIVDGQAGNEIVVFDKNTFAIVNARVKKFEDIFWASDASFSEFQNAGPFENLLWGTLAKVAQTCSRVEQIFQRPMDIEWGVDEMGRVFVFQARPIIHEVAIAPMAGM